MDPQAPDATPLHEALIDALYATFGRHPGYRVTHAKGVVTMGSFVASREAHFSTRAAHMRGQSVPIILRFSNFSGIPTMADADASASPRGLAVRFDLPDGRVADIVAHSFDGFPAATPAEFLEFVRAVALTSAPVPDPRPLDAFLKDHPPARRYLDAAMPMPGSYTSEKYYGVNAFGFVDCDGNVRYGRYRVEPDIAGPVPEDEREPREADYLSHELHRRLSIGPRRLRLVLQLAGPDDAIENGSIAWPHQGAESRAEVTLGIMSVEAIAPKDQNEALERSLCFDPARLVDGVIPSPDPMIEARGAIYRLAALRRRLMESSQA